MTSVFFIGLLVLMQIPLTIFVGYYRAKTGIRFFDGGDQVLLRRMRAHGNFTETVPISLLAMAAAEFSHMPHWILLAGGVCLVLGRLMHAVTLITIAWGMTRALGMVLTMIPMVVFGLWALSHSLVWIF